MAPQQTPCGCSSVWFSGIGTLTTPFQKKEFLKTICFQGELCLQSYAAGEIVMGVVGGIAVVLSVVIILAYRNYRYEQELDSLLWKVESSEIKVIPTNLYA